MALLLVVCSALYSPTIFASKIDLQFNETNIYICVWSDLKIQEITFPLNLGIATDLEIQVLPFTDSGTSINVHYDLRDITKTTVLTSNYEMPYRNLHSNNIVLNGEDYLNYKTDPNYVTDFVVNMLGVEIVGD